MRDLQITSTFLCLWVCFVSVDAPPGCSTTSLSKRSLPQRLSFSDFLLGCITSSIPQVLDLSLGFLPENVVSICIQAIHFSLHKSCPLLSGTLAGTVA